MRLLTGLLSAAVVGSCSWFCGGGLQAADLQLFGPVPYKSVADTPAGFLKDDPDCLYFLEDFEDGSLDFGIVITPGQVGPPDRQSGTPNVTDSVDADDGVIDGTGQSDPTRQRGYSFYSQSTQTMLVTFAELMTSAGLVWTDGDAQLTDVVFEVFDQTMTVIGSIHAGDLSDDSYQGTTDEDRFFGAMFGDGETTGIKALRISNTGGGIGIELDHIQAQRCVDSEPVPEPSTLVLMVWALTAFCIPCSRRR